MDPLTGLSLARIGIGAAALTSPALSARLFRLAGTASPQLPYLLRMFGTREVALGAITLFARGQARRRLAAVGVAVDLTDAVSGVLAVRAGSVSRATGTYLSLPALGAAAAGVDAVRR